MFKKWSKVLRKITAIFITAMMLLGVLPAQIVSAEQEGVLTYTLSGTDVTITGCDTTADNTQVQSAMDEIARVGRIVKIDDGAFLECKNLTSVTLPENLQTIGSLAFAATSLENIVFPSSVVRINDRAFAACSHLANVTLPADLQIIGDVAFAETALESVDFPSKLQEIGMGAFLGTPLTSVTFPNSLKTIGMDAFSRTKLSTVTLPASLTMTGIADYPGSPFREISTLQEVIFDEGTTTIPASVLQDVESVTSVTIPSTVRKINDRAFQMMSSLKSIDIPPSVTEIGNDVFWDHHSDFVINGEAGSAAQEYAKVNFIRFNPTNTTPPTAPGAVATATFNGHLYEVYDLVKSWKEAEAYCESIGGHLITITTQEEQNFFNTILAPKSPKLVNWLGATDELQAGVWRWVTDEPFSYANWLNDASNTGRDGRDYVAIASEELYPIELGQWFDMYNIGIGGDFGGPDIYGFICEWDNYGIPTQTPTPPAGPSYSSPPAPAAPPVNIIQAPGNETPSAGSRVNIPYHPSKDLPFSVSALEKVTDQASAVAAIRQAITEMGGAPAAAPPEAKNNLAAYAEEAVSQAASAIVNDGPIYINQSTISGVESAANAAKAAAYQTLSSGMAMDRDLRTMVNFKTARTDLKIIIEPSATMTAVDMVRVETPEYVLTFTKDFIRESVVNANLVIGTALTSAALPNTAALPRQMAFVNGFWAGAAHRLVWEPDTGKGKVLAVNTDGDTLGGTFGIGLPADPELGALDGQTIASIGSGARPTNGNDITGLLEAQANSGGEYYLKENTKDFQDIQNKSKDMREAITVLASRGIIEGTSATAFSPDKSISRAEVAALLSKCLSGLDTSAKNSFEDVKTGDWFYSAVSSIKKLGIMSGISSTLFKPNETIAKQQITVVAARTLRNRMGFHDISNTQAELVKFSDSASIANWAVKDIALASARGLITRRDDGLFRPGASMTRGEAAVILYKMYKLID